MKSDSDLPFVYNHMISGSRSKFGHGSGLIKQSLKHSLISYPGRRFNYPRGEGSRELVNIRTGDTPSPMLTYCQLHFYEHTSLKSEANYKELYWRTWIWTGRLQNWGYFVQTLLFIVLIHITLSASTLSIAKKHHHYLPLRDLSGFHGWIFDGFRRAPRPIPHIISFINSLWSKTFPKMHPCLAWSATSQVRFTHIPLGYFTGTCTITRLPQRQCELTLKSMFQCVD